MPNVRIAFALAAAMSLAGIVAARADVDSLALVDAVEAAAGAAAAPSAITPQVTRQTEVTAAEASSTHDPASRDRIFFITVTYRANAGRV